MTIDQLKALAPETKIFDIRTGDEFIFSIFTDVFKSNGVMVTSITNGNVCWIDPKYLEVLK